MSVYDGLLTKHFCIMITIHAGEKDNGYLMVGSGFESSITVVLINVGVHDTLRISVNTDVTDN